MKKFMMCFLAVLTVGIGTLCIYDKYMEKHIHNEKIELGKKNACEWINKKYGIDVEAVDVYVETEDDIFSIWEGDNVWVTVRDGDKEFHVETSGVEENADGCDDYQAEEIEKALIDMIKADISEDFEYDFYGDKMNVQRYNGKNLKEMLSGTDSLYVYFVNKDFEEVPVFDFLRRNIGECIFYSFSSEEIMKDYCKKDIVHQFIEEYVPFITNYRVVDFPKRDNECRKYDIKSYDDLLYYVPYEKTDGEIQKGFYEVPESEFDWITQYEIVSKAYGFDEKCFEVRVWIPIPDDKKDKDFYFAYSYYSEYDKKTVQKIEKCAIVGNYAVYGFHNPSNLKITLLCK